MKTSSFTLRPGAAACPAQIGGSVHPQPPTHDAETGESLTYVTCSDDLFLIAKDEVEAQEVTRNGVSVVCTGKSWMSADKVKVWSAGDLVFIQVTGRSIQSQSEFRVLGLHVGVKDYEASSAFLSLRKALTANSTALSVRWLR